MVAATQFEALLQRRLREPKYWVLLFFFTIGFFSIIGSIDTDWVIIGPIARFFNLILSNIATPLRLFVGVFLAVFVFQFFISLLSGEVYYLNIWGFLSAVLIVGILIALIAYAPDLFGHGNLGFSITPLNNMIGGP